MAKIWNGKTYDTDFYEIDPASGRRLSDQKDLSASEGWTNQFEPWRNTPGWHGQPLSADQEQGIQQTNPQGFAERQAWRTANPTQAYTTEQMQRLLQPTPTPTPTPFSMTPTWGMPPAMASQPQRGRVSGSSAGGSERDQIAQAYRTSLGREGSDDELNKWLSGGYGHGAAGNIGPILAAIANSGEARQRGGPITVGQNPDVNRPMDTPSQPSQPYQNTDYWSAQGVPVTQMFDLNTGQLLPGWQRTGRGYERTTGNVPGPKGGDFDSWLMQLFQGKRVSPRTLKELEPVLNQYGLKLGPPNARGFTDGVFLPDGTFLDVIEGATEDGGVRWQILRPTGSVGGPPAPPSQYNDPYTQYLEGLLTSRIGTLQQGFHDPNRAQYEQGLQDRARSLATGNAQIDQLMRYLQSRFESLQGPGYTGAEQEVIRTGALDPIEQDRSAAKKRIIEQLSARGLTLDSGIAQQAILEVDKAFDGMRATTQTQLAGNELARRENRNQRAETIAGQLADIPELRSREQLDVFQTLSNLSLMARQEDEQRAREAISYGGVLSDLGPQRMQLAMQAAGMGGNPSSLGSLLTQIAGLNQDAAGMNQSNSNALWSGLGSIAAIIARQRGAFGGAGI